MVKTLKGTRMVVEEEELDAMDAINNLELDEFMTRYVMPGNEWKTWKHPKTCSDYTLSMESAVTLRKMKTEFDACFKLIELTSSADYKKSKDGWKPRSKRKEMELLDMKYILVKDDQDVVQGFCSFMPTYEDDLAVIYLYEIHLGPALQGTGLGSLLMHYLEVIASRIPDAVKVMLTVFLCNKRAIEFYKRIGYGKDEYSPRPKRLRNGMLVEADYMIMSKRISHAASHST